VYGYAMPLSLPDLSVISIAAHLRHKHWPST